MDWLAQIFIFGFLALALFIASLSCESRGRFTLGVVLGGLELLSGLISSAAWADALWNSGKTDWFLLGILGYPPVGVIFWCMLGAGVFAAAKNLRGKARQKKENGFAGQI